MLVCWCGHPRGFILVFGRDMSALVAARRDRPGRDEGRKQVSGFYLAIATNTEAALLLPSHCARDLFCPCGRRVLDDVDDLDPLQALWPHDGSTACSSKSASRVHPPPARPRALDKCTRIPASPVGANLALDVCHPSLVRPHPLQTTSR